MSVLTKDFLSFRDSIIVVVIVVVVSNHHIVVRFFPLFKLRLSETVQ